MTTNVIKQIVNEGEDGAQTIKMVVKSNERGPQGMQGPRGIQGVPGPVGPRGADGSIQYQAGIGINITEDNVIEATGDSTAIWGGLRGDIQMQTDLQEEFSEYTKTTGFSTVAFSNDYDDLDNLPTIPVVNDGTLTISVNGNTQGTFTANSSTNTAINVETPIFTMTTTDPGEGAYLDTNSFVAVYGDEPIMLDYTIQEVDTGTKWVDGNAVYKKTVAIGSLPNATTKTVPHNIANFSQLIKVEGSFTDGTNSAPLPYPATTLAKAVQVYVDSSNIIVGTGENRSTYTGYVTIYYLKRS
jgi:hypothetical protein